MALTGWTITVRSRASAAMTNFYWPEVHDSPANKTWNRCNQNFTLYRQNLAWRKPQGFNSNYKGILHRTSIIKQSLYAYMIIWCTPTFIDSAPVTFKILAFQNSPVGQIYFYRLDFYDPWSSECQWEKIHLLINTAHANVLTSFYNFISAFA